MREVIGVAPILEGLMHFAGAFLFVATAHSSGSASIRTRITRTRVRVDARKIFQRRGASGWGVDG